MILAADRILSGQLGTQPSPLDAGPFRLVSLWEMLQFHAGEFVAAMEVLRTLGSSLLTFELNRDLTNIVHQLGNTEVRETKASFKEIRDGLLQDLPNLRKQLVGMRLRVSLILFDRLIEDLRVLETHEEYLNLKNPINDLVSRIIDELSTQVFVQIAPTMTKYFPREGRPLFGKRVARKFAIASDDIDEAGACLTCGRATACVMHLMRVMEIGVRRFAKRLNVTVGPKDTFGTIVRNARPNIAALPNGTPDELKRREHFNEIAVHLGHFCDGLRNSTMHPKRSYTLEQAENLFKNVGEFMKTLAKTV